MVEIVLELNEELGIVFLLMKQKIVPQKIKLNTHQKENYILN